MAPKQKTRKPITSKLPDLKSMTPEELDDDYRRWQQEKAGQEMAEPTQLTDFIDELHAMRRRCSGLQAAIEYIADNSFPKQNGVVQLAVDIVDQMDWLAEKFEAALEPGAAEEEESVGGPVAEAIVRWEAAQAAFDAAEAARDKPAADNLLEAESEACSELVEAPCANDAEFLEKLRCLTKRETKRHIRLFGSPFGSSEEISIARAAAAYFEQTGEDKLSGA